MSYELFLFKPELSRDPLDTAEQLLAQEEESGELNPGDPQPELEHHKQMLVVALNTTVALG